ncbi:MAG TPA: tetratricopeptide repeat protein, partial [Pirellulales bacterium]|nr:tetratricopeptide repeat protein [Pirellulales bacterium]
DDPQNGVLIMMLAQGLFATGNFNEAAGAVQQAMLLLSEDQWGVVVGNYRELYGKVGDYTAQLRALEKAVKAAPDDAGTRFLLGYHYGFLGYPQQAVKQLDKTLQIQPDDQLAKKLREQFQAKLPAGDNGQGGQGDGKKAQPNGNQADDKTAGDAKKADAKGA